ncbi:hypothetical protein [Actinomadura sp. 6N118]|uniref:hypothetical protein n=1 Tax=Actinomadura sp. 6N118 TaxID=3375151 RepID=UPI0037A5DE75
MRTRFVLLGAAAAMAGLAACGGGNGGTADKTAPSPERPASIKLSQTALGSIITDQSGRTLYAFVNDKAGTSSCSGECVATWPALASKGKVTADGGLNVSLMKHTQRSEGTFQATYGDWPLYYYAGDSGPGDLDGQGVDGEWFTVGADGKLVKREA